MLESFARRFSIARRPPSSLPAVTSLPTMRGSVSSPHLFGSPRSMPKPCKKPWSRSTPTVGWLMAMSSIAILALAASAPSVAAAHLPMSSPARKLSVAKVASAASIGSSGVSRAITTSPASRACLTAGTIDAVSDAVRSMPFAPSAMQVSMAWTWVSLSPSTFPAKAFRVMPSSSALAVAPSFILTKKGLVSVLVIRQTVVLAMALPATAVTAIADAPMRCMSFKIDSSLERVIKAARKRGTPEGIT